MADRHVVTSAAPNADLDAALAGRRVDPLNGAGWTALPAWGGASATWAAGPARLALSVPDGVLGGVSVARADFTPASHEWDALVRLRVTAGDGDRNTRTIVYVGAGADDVYQLCLWANGNVEAGRVVGGGFASAAIVAGPDAAQRTGGGLWLWVSRRPGHVDTLWGAGAGEIPSAWHLVAHDTAAASLLAAGGTYGRLTHVALEGVAGGYGVEVLAIRSKGGAPL